MRLVEIAPRVDGRVDFASAPKSLELSASTLNLPDVQQLVRSAHRPTSDGYDLRAGFYAPAGRSLRFETRIGAEAALRFAIAAWAPEGKVAPLRFRVSAGSGPRARALLERVVVPEADSPWQEVVVPLASLGAGTVSLELATSGDAAAWGGWAEPEISWRRPRQARPNIVLVSLDTLRPDHLGAYGYARRPTSPELDAFTARALRFSEAIAQAPWTRPSHRSMFSGRYPEFVGKQSEFLAARLWRLGYRTLALTGGDQLDKRSGFAQGFETFIAHQWIHRPEVVLERIAARPDRELFLFLHTYEIHDPYTDRRFALGMPRGRLHETFESSNRNLVHGEWRDEEKAYVEALYDGDLAYTDGQMGKLLDLLERAGLLADSIVVITSDHGEEFFEHGRWRHGHTLYDELLRVPLILWLPPGLRERIAPAFPASAEEPAVVGGQVGLLDLVPTIFELIGVATPADAQGRSILPLLRGERLPERPLVASSLYLEKARSRVKSLRTERYKLIAADRLLDDPGNEARLARVELFDLRQDRGEQRNVARQRSRAVQQLLRMLTRLVRGGSPTADEGMKLDGDEKLRKRLEALGYIGN